MKKRERKTTEQKAGPGFRSGRLASLDILKGFAIISVVIMHTWFLPVLYLVGAPFYIGQAVPILILVAGYTSAWSFLRYGSRTAAECYAPPLVKRRLERILVPFLGIWVVQVAAAVIILGASWTLPALIINLVTGGNGPGSYFIPVIVQHLFVVPILFLLALRNPRAMLAGAFFLDFILEFLMISAGMQPATTALIYARYLFAGALGVYLAVEGPMKNRTTAALGIVGFVFIYIVAYTGISPALWPYSVTDAVCHAPAYFWTLVLVTLGLAMLPDTARSKGWQSLGEIGKASWHIFLVQMTFFYLFWESIEVTYFEPMTRLFPPSIDFLTLPVGAVITIVICCGTGYAWYRAGGMLDAALKARQEAGKQNG